MEPIDAALDAVYARAAELKHSEDPEQLLRELLAPVRDILQRRLSKDDTATESEGDGSSDVGSTTRNGSTASAPSKAVGFLTDAASRFQTLVASRVPKPTPTQTAAASNYLTDASTRIQALFGRTSSARQSDIITTGVYGNAATKIQALVRGSNQRGVLSRQQSLLLQGTKVGTGWRKYCRPKTHGLCYRFYGNTFLKATGSRTATCWTLQMATLVLCITSTREP